MVVKRYFDRLYGNEEAFKIKVVSLIYRSPSKIPLRIQRTTSQTVPQITHAQRT
jgi:hypothetical protein